jgi:hypothetical protein
MILPLWARIMSSGRMSGNKKAIRRQSKCDRTADGWFLLLVFFWLGLVSLAPAFCRVSVLREWFQPLRAVRAPPHADAPRPSRHGLAYHSGWQRGLDPSL